MKKHNPVLKPKFIFNLLVIVLMFLLVGCVDEKKQKAVNISVVMDYFEAIDNRDASAMPELFAVDATQDFVGKDPLIGVEVIEANLALVLSQLQSIETEFLNLIAEKDTVLAHVKHVAVFSAGGVFKNRMGIIPPVMIFKEPTTVTWQALATFQLKGGMIVNEVIVRDELTMVKQMGTPTIN